MRLVTLNLICSVNKSEARRIAADMLKNISTAKALIFDLRDNIGGSPRMIEFISSYLFHQPTKLNMFFDRNGEQVSHSLTFMDIPGKRFAKDIPIYVLTSSLTFSAAEEFSYNLQSFNKAKIVGEITGGGAHPVQTRRANQFLRVTVPFWRAYNPITKTNWEGVGVIPDMEIENELALSTTIKLILEQNKKNQVK